MCGIWAIFGSSGNVSEQCNASHKITHRGPDAFRIENIHHFQNCCLGFHRLAIVDDLKGMQPMRVYKHPHIYLIFNGEIYNHKKLVKEFELDTSTDADGEPIIHLYKKLGPVAMAQQLDGVFAFCILDTANRKVILGRDTFGVKPLFRFLTKDGCLAVCSEAKGLYGMNNGLKDDDLDIHILPPGHVEIYTLDHQQSASLEELVCFHKPEWVPNYSLAYPKEMYSNNVKKNIAAILEAAVEKRLMAERRVGCLLSGGLDSSLIAALLVKVSKRIGLSYPLQTFAVGLDGSPDLKAARRVANYLGTEHHEVKITAEEGLAALHEVIYHCESYDIANTRSAVGLFLLSKYIQQKTNTIVILSGEGSDEVAQGYIYAHNAPSAEAAHKDSLRLLRDLHYFDVMRCDRSTSAWGLEVRVPFLDHQFVSYYLSLDPKMRQPQNGVEKHLLRSAFSGTGLLPDEILWRPKEAFSDGMANMTKSWFQIIQESCEDQISDAELAEAQTLYPHCPPHTKEALHYRRLFERHFPGKGYFMPYYWMPRWSTSKEPSARSLGHYKQ